MVLEDIIRNKHSGDDGHLEFIFSEEKKIIVTAPAGCGKTTAMVSKIAWELGKGTISSNKKVLAMTFSVNAAMKIKDSLKALLPELVEIFAVHQIVIAGNSHKTLFGILFEDTGNSFHFLRTAGVGHITRHGDKINFAIQSFE